jgi:hypothetical protein
MTISDYTDLLVTCSEYSGRDDFAHMFPRFVAFAESKLNKAMRVADMEKIVVITTNTAGEAALPPDYQEIREVLTPSGRPIELIAVTSLDDFYRLRGGVPSAYAIIGRTFYAIPQAAQEFALTYYAMILPLSPANPTNWLLEDGPLVYLYAVMAEIEGWAMATGKTSDRARLSAASEMLASELDAFKILDERRRWGNARVMVRGATP